MKPQKSSSIQEPAGLGDNHNLHRPLALFTAGQFENI